MSHERHDVVVIGAGTNGLAAAAYLGKAGCQVIVLEGSDHVGGVARALGTAGWLSPRIVAELDLARHGYQSPVAPPRVLVPLADGGWFTLHPDVSATVQSLRAHSPRDAERWPAFCELIGKLAGFLEHLYEAPPLNPQPRALGDLLSLAQTGRKLRGLGKRDMVELLRTLPMSAAELLDDWFESDALKGALGASAVHHMMQGPRGGGTAFVLVHHQVGRAAGAFRAAADVHATHALERAARAQRVQIRTGAPVTRVLATNGRVRGVRLADGTEVRATTVISTADPRRTFIELTNPLQLDPEFVHAVQCIKFRGVVAQAEIELSGMPRLEGADADGAVISISPSLDYLERAFDDAKYGRSSAQPHVEARVLSESGKLVMRAHVQYVPYHLREGTYDGLGAKIMETLGRHIPGFESLVKNVRVRTPRDIEAQFGVAEGQLGHGELTLDQILFMRPVAGYARYASPVSGLYLGGSGCHPGPGITGMSGRLCARAVQQS